MRILKSLAIIAVIGGIAVSFNHWTTGANAQDAAEIKLPAPGETPSPEGAKVYFIGLKDGATVKQKFTVRFGLKGMGVAPAGIYLGDDKPTGHHHLIIDAELPNLKAPFPMSENYRHFGGGQTEVDLELEPGEHTLQLVLGDQIHVPHNPPVMSKKITITVE